MNGGRCVRILKTGTKTRPPTPMKNMVLRTRCGNTSFVSASCSAGLSSVPFSVRAMTSVGTPAQMMLGMRMPVMMPIVETLPLIQSMMVVTSPIGENAPPALAARIIMPAYLSLVSLSVMIVLRTMVMTMLVVMLSRSAERMNVSPTTFQSNTLGFGEKRTFLTKPKPP